MKPLRFALVALTSVASCASATRASVFAGSDNGVSVPLSHAVKPRSANDLHPTLQLQQHLNRGLRRLERMGLYAGASPDEAHASLEKRIKKLRKRGLLPPPRAKRKRGMGIGLGGSSEATRTAWSKHKGAGAGGVGRQAAADSPSTDGADTSSQSEGGTGPPPPVRVAAAANNGSDTAQGFSRVDLQAAIDGSSLSASPPTAVNSLGLDIEANDVGYFTTVQIGTPPANFELLLDTGSADTWVPSSRCDICGPHNKLGPSSSTLVESTRQFQVTYGTGAVQGVLVQDTLSFAGLTLPGHTFGLAIGESVEFSDPDIPFDGLMGLALSTLSNQGVPTPLEALGDSGQVARAQMGFSLGRRSEGVNNGAATFGGVDATKFTAPMRETRNINEDGFWEVALDRISVDGTDLGLVGKTAILDTGTTLIIAPRADAEAIHAAIPGSSSDGQGGFTVPCSFSETVALTISGVEYSIQPGDITFLPVDQNNLAGDCISAISGGNIDGANTWLVGDAFLKNVYFAIDVPTGTIGLAHAA